MGDKSADVRWGPMHNTKLMGSYIENELDQSKLGDDSDRQAIKDLIYFEYFLFIFIIRNDYLLLLKIIRKECVNTTLNKIEYYKDKHFK